MKSRIRAIELEGFQTFKRPTRIEFADLTLLYGPNSAGKSAVLDALEVLRIATDIKNFDPKTLFSCVDRWASWLSTDRWKEIYEVERGLGDKNPKPIRTMTLSAEFDLQIIDPYEIFEEERIVSFRHQQRQLSFGGEDFVNFVKEFGDNSSKECIAKITLTFSVCGTGENAFEEDFFINLIEIELGGRRVARLSSGSLNAEDSSFSPIPEEELSLLVFDTPFTEDLVHNYLFQAQTKRGNSLIETFRKETIDRYGLSYDGQKAYKTDVEVPWQNYLQAHHQYRVDETDFDPLLVTCFVDIVCYFFGGLHEILHRSTQAVSADRKIPESSELSGTVEMGYTKYWWEKTDSSATAPLSNLKRNKTIADSHFGQLVISAHCDMLKKALDHDEWGSASAREQISRFTYSIANHDYVKESARFERINSYLANELFKESVYQVRSSSILLVPLDLSMEDVYHAGYMLLQDAQVTLSLVDTNGRQFEFRDVGSGISFVLPVLVCLTSGGVRFIQQPELHLHPALQASLADVFIDAAKEKDGQTIIETHSEHFLLRLLRRIRRTGLQKEHAFQLLPEEVAVYYFDPQLDGQTIVTRQFITPLGDFFNDWPRGFFADRDQDLLDGRL